MSCLNRESFASAGCLSFAVEPVRRPEARRPGEAEPLHTTLFIFFSLSFILVVLVVALYPVEVTPDL